MTKQDFRGEITQRVKKEMDRQRLSIRELATRSKLDHSILSRLLTGKRPWTLGHVEGVSKALGIAVSDMVADYVEIPIWAELTIDGFPYSAIGKGTPLGFAPIPRQDSAGSNVDLIANSYGVKITGNAMPPISDGSVLIVQQNSSALITDGDLVIYVKENGRGSPRRVQIKDDDTMVLQAMVPGHEDMQVHRKHISLCDKIAMIKLR
jgi:hypothetical protein